MSLEGLRWSCDSGSALYDTPPNGRSRTGWGGIKMFTEWLYAQLGNTYAYLPVYILILCAIFFICILLDKVRFSITKPLVNYIVDKWKLK